MAKKTASKTTTRKSTAARKKGPVKKAPAKKAPAKKAAPKATKGKQASPKQDSGKMSGLDAAAKVLGEAEAPLRAKQIVERMLEKGYWTTGGATPSATIYAAMLREIQSKGAASRFRRIGRGEFALNESK